MTLSALASVERVTIDPELLRLTLSSLQEYGKHGFEGLVLWLGEVHENAVSVSRVIVPDQEPISNETGLGYFVEGSTLFRLNRALALSGLRLIAQVHSHPTEAYHSETDDRYAIVTVKSGFNSQGLGESQMFVIVSQMSQRLSAAHRAFQEAY
jgi:hypothetical protein